MLQEVLILVGVLIIILLNIMQLMEAKFGMQLMMEEMMIMLQELQ